MAGCGDGVCAPPRGDARRITKTTISATSAGTIQARRVEPRSTNRESDANARSEATRRCLRSVRNPKRKKPPVANAASVSTIATAARVPFG